MSAGGTKKGSKGNMEWMRLCRDIDKCAETGRTRGGVSKAAWSSFIRLFDPLTRKVPSTSVAIILLDKALAWNREFDAPFSLRYNPLE